MTKRILTAVLALALIAVSITPAIAGQKKPKPYKSETVSTLLGHSVQNGNTGTVVSVTGQEFIARCAIPSSNGFDGYVFEVPKDYQKITSSIQTKGASATPYDIDIYLFDASCALTVAYNTTTVDEAGVLPKGTAYVFLHNFGLDPVGGGGPADMSFTLKP